MKFARSGFAVVTTVVFTGICSATYEIYETVQYLNNIVNTSVLNLEKKNPKYIYITDPKVKEDMVNEIWDQSGYNPRDIWAPFLMRWWNRRKRMMTWKLLEIAQSSSKADRTRAIEKLAAFRNLHDFEYRHIAQAADAQTLIPLARSKNVDLRFFLKSPSSKPNMQELIASMRDLLIKLNKKQRHLCIKYFLAKAFPNMRTLSTRVDMELPEFEGTRSLAISEENMLITCLESVVHHCSIEDNARVLVETGALPLLLEVLEQMKSSTEVTLLLGRLLMKISLYPELLRDLFSTGWLGVLAKWAQNEDQRLSVPACSALANLDPDYAPSCRYGPDIFLLHPTHRSHEVIKADVVLVHGLLGGIHYTWKQRSPVQEPITLFGITSSGDSLEMLCSRVESINDQPAPKFSDAKEEEENLGSDYQFILSDLPVSDDVPDPLPLEIHPYSRDLFSFPGNKEVRATAQKSGFSYCWPKDWLPEDCRNLRIVGINYDSHLSDWLSWCPLRDNGQKKTLAAKSEGLLQQLLMCGIGDRPVVWIAHSMGGLLVKHMLLKAWQRKDEKSKKFCKNTKAIIFLSTPHLGSPLASLNEASKLFLLPSPEVNELRANSPVLTNLHAEFLLFLKENPAQVITFLETECMKVTALELQFQCVPPNLGNSGVGSVYKIPLGHLDICKPTSKMSFIYQKILDVVKTTIGNNNK